MTKIKLVTKKGRTITMKSFFDCREDQESYEKQVLGRIDALEGQWKDTYKPELHDTLVMELVRSEMVSFNYEKQLANNKENEITPMLLNQERVQVRILREKLLITLRDVKGEEPPKAETKPPSMFDLGEQALEEELEPPEPESPEEKAEEKE